jgi:hypothetical protein
MEIQMDHAARLGVLTQPVLWHHSEQKEIEIQMRLSILFDCYL